MTIGSNAAIAAAGALVVAIGGFSAWSWSQHGAVRYWVEGIRAADLRNAQVEVLNTACANPQLTAAGVTSLPLRDGNYQLGQYQFELIGDIKYGDVSGHTNSGGDKAVFVGSCASGGQTTAQVLFVYGMVNGTPSRLATADLSNGGSSLVQSYDVKDGAIEIKQNQGNPPRLSVLSYALLNNTLTNVGGQNGAPAAQNDQVAQNDDESADDQDGTGDDTANDNTDTVSFQSFYDELEPYGQWTDNARWGQVWKPNSVSADFKPYQDGHWEDSDEYGTIWVSDYAWGDIPFHYGRWAYDPDQGWLWVPGYVWSPAWVAWRAGDGNIGWFPIPPGEYDGDGDFVDNFDDWYGYRGLYGASFDEDAFDAMWTFVPAIEIYSPRIRAVAINARFNRGFIGHTAGWTHFGKGAHGRLANRSLDGRRFASTFHKPMPHNSLHNFAKHHGRMTSVSGGHRIAARGAKNGGHGASMSAAHAHGPGGGGGGHSAFASHGKTAGAHGRNGVAGAHGRNGFSGAHGRNGVASAGGFGRSHSRSFGGGGGGGAQGFGGTGGGKARSFGGGGSGAHTFGGGRGTARTFGGGGGGGTRTFGGGGGGGTRTFGGGGGGGARTFSAPRSGGAARTFSAPRSAGGGNNHKGGCRGKHC